jgi:hypothetical protein
MDLDSHFNYYLKFGTKAFVEGKCYFSEAVILFLSNFDFLLCSAQIKERNASKSQKFLHFFPHSVNFLLPSNSWNV